ncbi:MAG: hypothetical protein DWQ04_33390 [Chloroflexi bacterium]|nr:MAG: hypothetical protein DWQ04_33390 [Chloroflexota bacterium]
MTTYTCPPHVKWVIDAQQTIVINEQSGEFAILSDIDAMLWSWLTLNYSYKKLLTLISAIEMSQPEKLLRSTLQKWANAGLLLEREA